MSTPEMSTPQAFHLLAKPTGAVCNLDCAYCFFLSKEMLYPGSRFRMADEMLETYIRQLIESHTRVRDVQIAWQGGEPTLMGLDFFRRSVELANRYLESGRRTHGTGRVSWMQPRGIKPEGELRVASSGGSTPSSARGRVRANELIGTSPQQGLGERPD